MKVSLNEELSWYRAATLTERLAGHPGMVAHEDFVGSDAVKDRFGHGTHVATMAAGMRKA